MQKSRALMLRVVLIWVAVVLLSGCGGEAREPPASFAPSWSPDNRRILFQVNPDPSFGCPYGACRPTIEVWVMDVNGEHARMLARGTSTAWSPDGRRIAFATWDGDIYTIGADGTSLRRLTRGGGSVFQDPAWSPDGTKIAFVRWPSGNGPNKLYVMNADGTRLRRLSRVEPYECSWSPTGMIAVTTFDGLFTIDADRGRLKRLFSSTTVVMGESIAWSPDAGRIAFGVERGDGTRGFAVVDTDGRLLVPPFTRTRGTSVSNEDDPTWSPDGRKIAFVRPDEPNPGIYVVAASGGDLKRLATSGTDPAWSPDGRRIAFSDGDIYVMNADGSAKRNISRSRSRSASRGRTSEQAT